MAKNRRQRLDECTETIYHATYQIFELQGEVEDQRDNLPENLQCSAKYDQLDELVDAIGEVRDLLEQAQEAAETIEFS